MITQRELRELKKISNDRLLLDRESRRKKEEEDKMKKSFLHRSLEEKEETEKGKWKLSVSFSVFPAWKQAFVDACGVEAAKKVQDKTKPSPVLKIVEDKELSIKS